MCGLTRGRVLAVAAAVEVLCAVLVGGRMHPDEVHQYLEPAHRLAFGYGNRAHEWYAGMRNLAAPSVLAGLWRLLAALGVEHPRWLLAGAWLCVGALSVASLGLVYDLVARRRADPADAGFATLLLALWVPWQEMAFRTLGETLSAAALVLAVSQRDHARWARAGLAAGLAFALRYPAGLFVLVLCVDAWRAPRRADTARFALGLGGALAALGALDAYTWGAAFHSVRAYAGYNLVRGQAAAVFGARPWWWYAASLPLIVPAALWVGALWGARGRWRDAGLPGALAAGYLAGMSLLAHKEPRFALAAAPFVLVALVLVRPVWSPAWRRGVLAMAVVQSLVSLAAVKHGDVREAGVRRAVWSLYAAPDVGALWVLNRSHPGWSALHRAVPLSADASGRLGPALVALDASLAAAARHDRGGWGRVYALCDAHGDAPARCDAAMRQRGFDRLRRVGAVTVWAR